MERFSSIQIKCSTDNVEPRFWTQVHYVDGHPRYNCIIIYTACPFDSGGVDTWWCKITRQGAGAPDKIYPTSLIGTLKALYDSSTSMFKSMNLPNYAKEMGKALNDGMDPEVLLRLYEIQDDIIFKDKALDILVSQRA